MPRESAIDPARYMSLGLTHVQYDANDRLAKLLALVTLSPIFLLCAYVTIILYRRELTFINALIGQLGCEAFNWFLKRLIRQPRPHAGTLGKGYGMPSSHSQFVGFFAAFFICHFWLHHPIKAKPRTLVNTMRRAEHVAVIVAIVLLTAATCFSRYYLSYHTPAQILVGLTVGLALGGTYYYVTEHVSRQPLRLPAPLGSPMATSAPNSPFGKQAASNKSDSYETLRNRRPSGRSSSGSAGPDASPRQRRRSSLSSFVPEFHPAPPLRQIVLDHPLAVAFRLRDSWTVWRDGGIEGEYGTWRKEWERRREWCSASTNNSKVAAAQPHSFDIREPIPPSKRQSTETDLHSQNMIKALRLADQCEATQTAFCVGCVITASCKTQTLLEPLLASGYSRELPGNTHAEQCALQKIEEESLTDSEIQNSNVEELSLDLYTTMEPCSERLSGALPCVDRILAFNEQGKVVARKARDGAKRPFRLRITRVFQGVREPEDFVACVGTSRLRDAGIEVATVRAFRPLRVRVENGREKLDGDWLEKECLRVAKFGHPDQPDPQPGAEKMWKG